MAHWTENIRSQVSELVGTFNDRRNAKEWLRLLKIGCVHNKLGVMDGRIVQHGNKFEVLAIKKVNSWNEAGQLYDEITNNQ